MGLVGKADALFFGAFAAGVTGDRFVTSEKGIVFVRAVC